MTERVVRDEIDKKLLLKFLEGMKPPYVVSIVKGKPRTVKQNKLQWLLLSEIAEQLGDRTVEEVRGYCKLTLGVPILRAEDDTFRERYDAIVKPLPYEHKLLLMQEPISFPITSLMTTEQKTRYIDGIYQHFCEKGLVLTVPESER